MKKFNLKPFDLKAFKDGAIALTDDKTLFAKFVYASLKHQGVYPILVAYFPVSYLFLEAKFLSPVRVESVTREGYYTSKLFHDEGDSKDLTYIVDGLTELDLPVFDIRLT